MSNHPHPPELPRRRPRAVNPVLGEMNRTEWPEDLTGLLRGITEAPDAEMFIVLACTENGQRVRVNFASNLSTPMLVADTLEWAGDVIRTGHARAN